MLYPYKPKINPFMKCCCHIMAGAPKYYLQILVIIRERISKVASTALVDSIESLTFFHDATSLSLFWTYYFGMVLSLDLGLPNMLTDRMILWFVLQGYMCNPMAKAFFHVRPNCRLLYQQIAFFCPVIWIVLRSMWIGILLLSWLLENFSSSSFSFRFQQNSQ